MISQNLEEYRLIKNEIDSINACVTKFLGYLFGGSGLIVIGVMVGVDGNPFDRMIVSFSMFGYAIIVSSMMTILIYKFVSHNRYNGYLALLGSERWAGGEVSDAHLFLWHSSIGKMREHDNKNDEAGIFQRGKFLLGLGMVALSLIGRFKTASWAYPNSVVRIFFLASWSFFSIGVYGVVTMPGVILSADVRELGPLVILILGTIIQCIIWISICSRYWSVMQGDATVGQLKARMEPHRRKALEDFGIETDSYPILRTSQER